MKVEDCNDGGQASASGSAEEWVSRRAYGKIYCFFMMIKEE